jgi:hypothetical protein
MEKNPTSKYDLLYFSNPNSYKKTFEEQNPKKNLNTKDDIKFYRKRIIHLTKALLKNETETTTSINASFQNYIHEVISHFEFIDKKDIMQKEYENYCEKKKKSPKNFKMLEKDQLIMKDIKENKKNMKNFVIHKNKPIKVLVPPKIKKINLKTDELKKKGINKEKSK